MSIPARRVDFELRVFPCAAMQLFPRFDGLAHEGRRLGRVFTLAPGGHHPHRLSLVVRQVHPTARLSRLALDVEPKVPALVVAQLRHAGEHTRSAGESGGRSTFYGERGT